MTVTFRRWVIAASCLVAVLYLAHYLYCAASPLPYMTFFYTESDMHANYRWAASIVEQGLLNPAPYHPYTYWMQQIAPFPEWLSWWRNPAIYQQSPLYTYLLALCLRFSTSVYPLHFVQTMGGLFLCAGIGWLGFLVTENRGAGLLAFIIAGLYAPFYAYSWPLLRDMPGWVALVATAIVITRWWRAWEQEGRQPSRRLSLLLGLTLAAGLLCRETYYVLIPVVVAAAAARALRARRPAPLVWLLLALALGVAPLVARNAAVGAPLLSSSNRFAETFIQYNAPGGSPVRLTTPPELRSIMERSQGRPLAVVRETMALYDGNYLPLLRRELAKAVSLLDRFEVPDNQCMYYLETISPVVRFGLSHWMVIVPGVLGLFLSLWRRDRRHLWLWVLWGCLFLNLLAFSPMSRYRQTLALFWIPWAAWYLHEAWGQPQRKRATMALPLVVGWGLSLWISAERPRTGYYRFAEFELASRIYEAQGDTEKAKAQAGIFEKLTKP